MPHLTIQYTDNVYIDNPTDLLDAANQTLWRSGEFSNPEELKSRIIKLSDFLVGTYEQLPENQQSESFVYVHLKLMATRSDETKNQIAQDLIATVQRILLHHKSLRQQSITPSNDKSANLNVQVCVEIEDIAPCYHKSLMS